LGSTSPVQQVLRVQAALLDRPATAAPFLRAAAGCVAVAVSGKGVAVVLLAKEGFGAMQALKLAPRATSTRTLVRWAVTDLVTRQIAWTALLERMAMLGIWEAIYAPHASQANTRC
jgi:hypothetical protein